MRQGVSALYAKLTPLVLAIALAHDALEDYGVCVEIPTILPSDGTLHDLPMAKDRMARIKPPYLVMKRSIEASATASPLDVHVVPLDIRGSREAN